MTQRRRRLCYSSIAHTSSLKRATYPQSYHNQGLPLPLYHFRVSMYSTGGALARPSGIKNKVRGLDSFKNGESQMKKPLRSSCNMSPFLIDRKFASPIALASIRVSELTNASKSSSSSICSTSRRQQRAAFSPSFSLSLSL